MKIALLLEKSQYSKNNLIANIIQDVLNNNRNNHEFYNIINTCDKSLTSIHLGIRASILLNAKAIDFIITGCATGQETNISLNSFPGVVCSNCFDPTDAWFFKKYLKGNAISLAFDKGCGLGWELKFKDILLKIFDDYDSNQLENKQSKKIVTIKQIKYAVAKNNFEDILDSLDSKLLYQAIKSENFVKCYFANSKNVDLDLYILNKLNRDNMLLLLY